MNNKVDTREDFYRYVLTTAAAGGINYWADFDTERGEDGLVERITNVSEVEFGDLAGDITPATIRDGLRRILSGEVKVGDSIRKYLVNADRYNDAGDVDADGADVIVQAGLYGQILFG